MLGLLRFGQDRLVRREVGAHRGLGCYVVAVGHFDEVLHDRLLLLEETETSSFARLARCGMSDIECGDRAAGSLRDRNRHLGGAARHLGSIQRDQDVQRAAFWLLEVNAFADGDCKRTFERSGGACDVGVKRPILGGIRDPDEQEVVALLRFFRHCRNRL